MAPGAKPWPLVERNHNHIATAKVNDRGCKTFKWISFALMNSGLTSALKGGGRDVLAGGYQLTT